MYRLEKLKSIKIKTNKNITEFEKKQAWYYFGDTGLVLLYKGFSMFTKYNFCSIMCVVTLKFKKRESWSIVMFEDEEKKLNNDTTEKENNEISGSALMDSLNSNDNKEVDPSTRGRLMVEEGRKRRRKRKNLFDFGLNLLQLAIVAVFVIGVLSFAKNKLDAERDVTSIDKKNEETVTGEDETETGAGAQSEESFKFELVLNIKKHALIVNKKYKGKDPEVFKVMKCNIGNDVKKGEYKIKDRYSWTQTGDLEKTKGSTATHPGKDKIGFSTYFGGKSDAYWSQYTCRYAENLWIGSVYYTNPYKYYMVKESYDKLGKYDLDGGCIQLCVRDAKWIFKNCPDGTKFTVEKGKKSDKLSMKFEDIPERYKKCGWDPTDSSKQNPYNKASNGNLVVNENKIIVERGSKIDYLANVLLLSDKGKDITRKVKYDETTSAAEDEHVVEYSYKKKDGTKLKAKIKYKIVDTTPPIVRFTSEKKDDYVVKTKEKYEDKLTNDKLKKEIEDKLKKVINASDLGSKEDNKKIEFNYPKKIKFGDNIIRMSIKDYYGNETCFNAVINIEYEPK